MYLIRKDNKYYLTYSKDVVDKFNSEHNGYMCDVTLLEEHNIPEKEEPPKYIPDSGKFFNLRGITTPSEYATITIPHEAITTAARSVFTNYFNGYPYPRYEYSIQQPTITTGNINSGATS
jgi:hypothetical protein